MSTFGAQMKLGVTKAIQLIEPLRAGLAQLVERPSHFEQFDSPNGYGRYVHFVPFRGSLPGSVHCQP